MDRKEVERLHHNMMATRRGLLRIAAQADALATGLRVLGQHIESSAVILEPHLLPTSVGPEGVDSGADVL